MCRLAISECGRPSTDGQVSAFVINGEDAAPDRWPWHGGLLRQGFYICGASLVGSRHVVTAAHCVT